MADALLTSARDYQEAMLRDRERQRAERLTIPKRMIRQPLDEHTGPWRGPDSTPLSA